MERLSTEYVNRVAQIIWEQLKCTVGADVLGSWGISQMEGTQIVGKTAMAALELTVNGYSYQGNVCIALDEGSDTYRIYTRGKDGLNEYRHDVYSDEMGGILDTLIETGDMSPEEYQAKIVENYGNIMAVYLLPG